MKKFILGFIMGAMLMCAIPSLAKTDTVQAIFNGVKVVINGEKVSFANGEEPVTINSRTYVPAKYVAEALGAKVQWDGKTSTVNISDNTTVPSPGTSTNGSQTNTEAPIIPKTSKDDIIPNDNMDRHTKLFGKLNLCEEKTSDGLYVYTYKNNPQKFVLSNDILSKYHSIRFKTADGTIPQKYILALKRTSDKKELIHEVEYLYINDLEYFTLDYYENTMLPIIKAEG